MNRPRTPRPEWTDRWLELVEAIEAASDGAAEANRSITQEAAAGSYDDRSPALRIRALEHITNTALLLANAVDEAREAADNLAALEAQTP